MTDDYQCKGSFYANIARFLTADFLKGKQLRDQHQLRILNCYLDQIIQVVVKRVLDFFSFSDLSSTSMKSRFCEFCKFV